LLPLPLLRWLLQWGSALVLAFSQLPVTTVVLPLLLLLALALVLVPSIYLLLLLLLRHHHHHHRHHCHHRHHHRKNLKERLYRGTGKGQEEPDAVAYRSFESALQLEPSSADVWCALGLLFHQTKQLDAALQAFVASVRLKPHSPHAWAGLGRAYDASGQKGDALQAFELSLALSDPWATTATAANTLAATASAAATIEDSGLRGQHATSATAVVQSPPPPSLCALVNQRISALKREIDLESQ